MAMIEKVAIAFACFSVLLTIDHAEETLPKGWTSLEQTAWASIQRGEQVDVQKISPNSKTLGAEFLRDILANQSLAARIPPSGISIAGAYIGDALLLNGIPTIPSLTFTDCQFGSIQLRYCKCSGVRFISSSFESLVCEHTTLNGLDIENLKINGVPPLIKLDNCDINDLFQIYGTDSKKVSMSFIKTQFNTAVSIGVAANYSMDDAVFENDVFLFGPGDFLEARHLHAKEGIIFAVNAAKIRLPEAQIAGTLEITTGVSGIRELDLRGAVLGKLLLPDLLNLKGWDHNAHLILTDAKVDIVSDYRTSWPDRVQLEGFAYGKWRPKDNKGEETLISRWNGDGGTKNWFLDWIRKQPSYSPEVYNELASFFKAGGMSGQSNEILFQGKERERHHSHGFARLLATLSLLLTGYGYHYEFAFYWCFAFVLLGTIILLRSEEARSKLSEEPRFGRWDSFFYSLDAFLPIVKLRNEFGKIDFISSVKYYFYFHRLAGFVIGFFIVADLTGLYK
jgi:hypothetical protein